MDIAQTRTLRVALDGDSSGYVQAMNEKVAADKAAVASGKEVSSSNQQVGASFTSTTTKLSQSGDILARLQRQYVDGVAAAQKFNTAIATLGRGIETGNVQMAQASDILDGIYKKYGMMANASKLVERGQLDLAKAVEQANARLAEQQKRQPGANQNVNHYQAVNVAYQAQDVITQAFGGASAATVALQQGPQLAMSLGEGGAVGAVKTLVTGLGSLLSVTNLASIAFVALGTVGIQYAMKLAGETKSLSDALKDQEEILKRIASAYGGVAEEAAKAGTENRKLVDALATRSNSALTVATTSEAKDFFSDSKVGTTAIGGRFRGFQSTVTEFQEPLAKLRAEIKAGKGDFDGFYDAIARKVEANPSLAKAGNDVIALSEKLKQATDAMKELQRVRDALFNDRGPNGRLLSQGTTNTADAGNLALYQSQQRIALQRSQQSFDAQLGEVNARGTAQRVAAARAVASAQYNDESPDRRRQRVDQAGLMVQAQAEKAIADAQRERSLSLQKLLDDQQFEISLVGKTADQAEILRKEYELTSQIKMQAARDGNDADQKELDAIHQKIQELDKLKQAYKALNTGVTSRGFVIGSPAEQDYFDYTDSQRLSLDQGKETFDAQAASARARTIAERVAAARQTAEAQHPNESAPQRDQRISQATQLAQIQAEQQLRDAQRERKIALDQTIQDQQAELSLVGKTGGEAAALRKEYELTSQLRLEAARNGTKVDQDELDLIKQRSVELGKLTDAYNKAKLTNDLSLERDQIFRSPTDQQVASRLQSAGRPIDLQSEEAQMIRQNLQTAALKDNIKGFMTDLQSELVKSGGKIGEALGSALKNSAMNILTKIGDQAVDKIANFLVSALTGGGSGTSGGVGSTAAWLLSGGVSGRTLTAANSNVAGAGASAILSGLPATSTSQTGVAAQAWNFFASKGLQPHQIAGILGNMSAESSFNPKAVGDSGSAFGLFQNHADRGGGQGLISSGVNGQLDHAWAELQGPENKAFKALMSSTDVKGATAAFAGFERPRGFSWGNPEGADNFSGRLNAANDALTKFGSTTSQATQGVGALGSGLGQLGQQLGGAGASAGGGFNWSSLTSPSFQANSTLGDVIGTTGTSSTPAQSTGGAGIFGSILSFIPKLFHFADGTGSAPGGLAMVGERGRELVNLPRGSQVVPTHKTESLLAAAANSNSSGGRTKVDVGVSVDNNGNLQAYVKNVADERATQKVQGGLADYTDRMRQEGFGQIQTNFMAEKG